MLISLKHRFVFVHIGKNGGNSIARALAPFSTPGYWTGDSPCKHWPAFQIQSEILGPTWTKYFSFGFVSNPWRWLHASHHYLRMTAAIYNEGAPHPGLAPWARWKIENPDQYTTDWIHRATELSRLPFSDFVRNECADFCQRFPGGQIRKWMMDREGRPVVSYIGKYENLQSVWPELCVKLGIPEVALEHLNPTILMDGSLRSHRDYTEEYNPVTRALVAEAFQLDIDQMGYTFGG